MNEIYALINQIRNMSGLDLNIVHQDTIYKLYATHKIDGTQTHCFSSENLHVITRWLYNELRFTKLIVDSNLDEERIEQ